MRLIRVFPRKTKATPDDGLAYFGPPDLFAYGADEVHVSVTFTYDKSRAEQLAEQWRHVAPVKVGGVAYGDDSLEFIPGRYVKPGYTITSRGCPRRCWFCGVWKKWPVSNALPIYDGWNILDDNLLACPREHVEAVFAMLHRQGRRVEFTGGLEALSLEDYQVGLLADLKPRPNMFFAYDPGDAPETLESAARRLLEAGFTRGVASPAMLLSDRLPERHADLGREPFALADLDRLYPLRNVVEAGNAITDEVCSGRRMAEVCAAVVQASDHPRQAGGVTR